MKIRTRLIGSMIFFGLALLIITASVITTNQHVNQLSSQEDLVKNAELKANELSYLSNDYLLYHESQQIDRWESKFASLSEDMSNLSLDTTDQQVLAANIRENEQRLRDVFHDIETSVESRSLPQSAALDPAFIQVSWSRIGVQTQGIVFDASRLQDKIHEEKDQLNLINNLLISALLGIFAIFLLASYYLIYRITLKSISDLQAGTQIVGDGNLDYVIEEKKGDEFGELAGAFNRMTARLKKVTASKLDLENEVAERIKAENALYASKADLVQANESLQVKQEELQLQTEVLEAQMNELRAINDKLEKVSRALQESEEKYRTIVETAQEGIWLVNDQRITLYANQRMAEMLGYTVEEMIGRPARDFIFPEDIPEHEINWDKSVSGQRGLFEFRYRKKDGSPIWMLLSNAPYYQNGSFTGMLGMFTDITVRRRAEKELLEAKMQAELYLDLMSHDINNMHQIAIGYLELASESIEIEGSDRELIVKPLEVMQRSAKLIENVRKLQRIQKGEIKDDAVDLDEVLSRVVGEYREVADGKIIYNNGTGPHRVLANELLNDVFTNLVGNAIKHSNGSGVNISVRIDKVREGDKKYYIVSVEDSGPGIPDEMKKKVFNRLQRGETMARGMGLGLYLVKSLVDSYHGRVWVEDRVQGDHRKGSRFVVMLPAL
jgi:PAS domain S-box-containing protein